MFARITKFHLKTEKIDTGIKLYQKSVVPAARAEKGFRRLSLMVTGLQEKGFRSPIGKVRNWPWLMRRTSTTRNS